MNLDSEKSVTAVFERIEYSVNTSVEGEGTLTINPVQDKYFYGDEISITVQPSDGWNFVHWSGDLEGTENPVTVTIQSNLSATANLDNSPFAGGNGSELYPYQVSTVEQLQEIRNHTDKHFIQINDIDANITANWNDNQGFQPIGERNLPFKGSYNGLNHLIINLYMNYNTRAVGIFGYVSNGLIQNIMITNVSINGTSDVGGVAGSIWDGSLIQNVKVDGVINGIWTTGGIVGYIENSTLDKVYSSGEVFGSMYVGGITGENASGTVRKSYTDVNLLINTTAFVNEERNFGGLVGTNSGIVENSYFSGIVNGGIEVGGLIGVNNGSVSFSFSFGTVSGTEDVGGLIGINANILSDIYWDEEESGQNSAVGRGSSDGTTGLTTSEMQGTSAEDNMSEFDWNEIWITTDNYPILRWQ